MNRFYVPFHAGLKNLWIDSSESHHIIHVKRLKIGDSIIVFNGTGDEFEAEIEDIEDNRVNVRINQQRTISKENIVEIDIAFAIPKGKRSHLLIQKCAELGVDCVIISNHGGIASDAALAPIDVLPSVVREVGDKMTVIVDSGFRRGSDILKGLALGADAVIIGRATLYGVSAAGEPGATRALEILQTELRRTMGVLALTDLADITRDHVVMPHELPL